MDDAEAGLSRRELCQAATCDSKGRTMGKLSRTAQYQCGELSEGSLLIAAVHGRFSWEADV